MESSSWTNWLQQLSTKGTSHHFSISFNLITSCDLYNTLFQITATKFCPLEFTNKSSAGETFNSSDCQPGGDQAAC